MYKLIVVEDESLAREGIVECVKNSDTGLDVVGQAEDGEQALQLIKEKMPDVIITDIAMPKMGGLELVECVKEINPEIKVIIISGYNDFTYAQRAMSYGVQDYLLKPVLPEQIREILKKVRIDLERQQALLFNIEQLRSQVLESLPIVRERFFNEIIHGKLSLEQITNKSAYLNVDLTGDLFGISILKIKDNIEAIDSEVRKTDMIYYFINDFVNKIFDRNIKIHTLALTDNEVVVVFCVKDKNLQKAFITINQSTSRIIAGIQKYMNVNAFATIGKLYNSIHKLKNSFEEAVEALNYSVFQKGSLIINYEDVCSNKNIIRKRPMDLEAQLILHVKLCEMNNCMKDIDNFFEFYMADNTADMRCIKIEILELVLILFRNIEENEEDFSGLLYTRQISVYQEIQKCDDVSELKKWLVLFVQAYMKELKNMYESRSVSLVERAKKLINLYISDENFSLNDVASKLFLSPNYLRQIFKQHTGETFVEYLTRIRMEKALALMKDTTLKIQDIAEQVGYSNQRYFAICFKKHFQMTPSDYRELHFL